MKPRRNLKITLNRNRWVDHLKGSNKHRIYVGSGPFGFIAPNENIFPSDSLITHGTAEFNQRQEKRADVDPVTFRLISCCTDFRTGGFQENGNWPGTLFTNYLPPITDTAIARKRRPNKEFSSCYARPDALS
jgi:hypothetical protein